MAKRTVRFRKTTGELTLVIEKLPPIEISSSFPFETLITALAGVIAAGITGWVAYRAIKEICLSHITGSLEY